MGTSDCWNYLTSLGVQHHSWHDPVLAKGLVACAPLAKIPCIDIDEEDFFHPSIEPIVCSVGGCKKTFTTVAEHAAHQRSCHQHVCSTCKHSFPTHHLLDLHLLEVHDTLFQLMAEKKMMYQCLLETCSEKFKNPTERHIHCIELHRFPSNFRYDMSWRKQRKKNCKNARNLSAEVSSMECEVSLIKDENAMLFSSETNEMAGIKSKNENVRKSPKVPCNLSFGTGVSRGFSRGGRGSRGQGKKSGIHWHQRKYVPHSSRTKLEEVNMKDLEAALPSEPECS
ncbi:zinc finger protein 511-like isoform X2 [Eriocheir sinensis]|nr:zinc finger protein 511-like isoform X2 [Eriocheir sinensis]XP_050712770.1 zinc finger protein 511-like isoform X2 [Eriocheir sinensis]XP_050712772.1 zinc finger protein 511-like isoform X2 [Eriocheir sinensis]XP_050712773.1 zinc finger protein 511-like isoform X2 [Eriocheir sinensis]